MSDVTRIVRRLAEHAVVAMVCGYRVVLAPLLVGQCKFVPTCSEYMIQAVHEWGPLRGVWIGLRRLVRCRPGGPGGFDPVPPKLPAVR